MRRSHRIRRVLLIALVLPSIAAAISVQGPCGLCERGLPCPDMERTNTEPQAHSCCSGGAAGEQDVASEDALDCSCGRGPVSVAPTLDRACAERQAAAVGHAVVVAPGFAVAMLPEIQVSAPAAPPPLPAYLAGCAFLT